MIQVCLVLEYLRDVYFQLKTLTCHLTPNWTFSFLNLHLVLKKNYKNKNQTYKPNQKYYSNGLVCLEIRHDFLHFQTVNQTLKFAFSCLELGLEINRITHFKNCEKE